MCSLANLIGCALRHPEARNSFVPGYPQFGALFLGGKDDALSASFFSIVETDFRAARDSAVFVRPLDKDPPVLDFGGVFGAECLTPELIRGGRRNDLTPQGLFGGFRVVVVHRIVARNLPGNLAGCKNLRRIHGVG